jgi:hypothetical protein
MIIGSQQRDAMTSSNGYLLSLTENIIYRPQKIYFQELGSGFYLTHISKSGKTKAHLLSYGCMV